MPQTSQSEADKQAALRYILDAWEEALHDGIEPEMLANAALFAALADLIGAYGEDAVAKMTSRTAALYGLGDRGVLAPGYLGDVNVIDLERLQLRRPEVAHDLPGDAKRLIQRADGYVATIKGGEVLMDHGEDTGLRTGSLLRGPR